MCGICGIINFQKDKPVSAEALKRMNGALVHRGPDDEGMHLDTNIGIAVRRLSIIDLITGHQPIHNEDESVWLVLNGEIYNYKELRAHLQSLGHRFYTSSDAEVVVHAYEQYGQDGVSRLRGMFAFALWDKNRRVLTLARDRLGIKPLYYSIREDRIIFASTTKAIFAEGLPKTELNLGAVDQFFSFGYVPGSESIFCKIQKLPPAHILTAGLHNKIEMKEYWRLEPSTKLNLSEDECLHKLSQLLEESIKLHIRSDVPVGIFLSGGIDSSTITYMVDCQKAMPLKTFSIGFDDEKVNELKFAKIIADRFKTQHHESFITDTAIDSLPQIIEHLSEPLADMSIIPTYFISKETSSGVKVVLSGEGGDEMFAGYPWYKVSSLSKLYQRLPLSIRHYFADMIKDKKIRGLEERTRFYNRLKWFLMYSALPSSGQYLWRRAYFNQERKNDLFSEDFKEDLKKSRTQPGDYPFGEEKRFNDFLTTMLYYDTKLFLPDDLLAKMDQMTMAHGLEGRVPFLDHKLVEFAASLPPHMKLNRGISKYVLKRLVSSKLPEKILTKPKQGLMPPVRKWINARLDNFFLPILNEEETKRRPYFNQAFIKEIVHSHKNGYIDHSSQIWMLVVFELWMRTHFDHR